MFIPPPSMALKMLFMYLDFKYKNFSLLIKVLGLATVLKIAIKVLYKIYKYVLRPSKNLGKRYGPNSYAMITGASDDIGKSFAIELGKRGFNLVLIARSQEKLQAVAAEVNRGSPKVEIKIICADFKEAHDLKLYDNITDEIKNLDISVLINNVTVDSREPFTTTDESKIVELIAMNTIPEVVFCRRIIPLMLTRPKQHRSLIVNVASAAGTFAQPYHSIYSASKAFVDTFSRAMSLEFSCRRLDVISLRPFYVTSPEGGKRSFEQVSPQECVRSTLARVGYDFATYGSLKHAVQGGLMEYLTNIPYCLQTSLWKVFGRKKEEDKNRLKEFESKVGGKK